MESAVTIQWSATALAPLNCTDEEDTEAIKRSIAAELRDEVRRVMATPVDESRLPGFYRLKSRRELIILYRERRDEQAVHIEILKVRHPWGDWRLSDSEFAAHLQRTGRWYGLAEIIGEEPEPTNSMRQRHSR